MKVKLDSGAFMPERAHPTDAGLDLLTPISFALQSGHSYAVDTGVHIQLPPGTVGMLKSKSGLNTKFGITSEGVIDEGYTGTIVVKLYNHGPKDLYFSRGEKITQLVILPVLYESVELADKIEGGLRGYNGFGSTGR